MGVSGIQWLRPPTYTDLEDRRDGYTYNPIRGCMKVSRGCKNCYAETLAKRNPKVLGHWGEDAPRSFGTQDYLIEPLDWNAQAVAQRQRRLVMLGSLFDIGEQRSDLEGMQDFVLGPIIKSSRALDWILTTKRPKELLENVQRAWQRFDIPEWPPHVWPLVTTEGQAELKERTPAILSLIQAGAPVIGLSLEPLLDNPVRALRALLQQIYGILRRRCQIWLIWGGESGSGSRPFDCDWIRQGRQEASVWQRNGLEIFCFVKQLGNAGFDALHGMGGPQVTQPDLISPIQRWTGEGGNPFEWPDDLKVRQWPGRYPANYYLGGKA